MHQLSSTLLKSIKHLIENAKNNIFRNINTTMLLTYFEIGRIIVEDEKNGGGRAEYVKEILKKLSKQLTKEFGRGYSISNLEYFRKFYLTFQGRIPQSLIGGVLNEYMNRDIQVWTIKDNYRLGSDINSKVLAFVFGLSAEIERKIISQRTKEALTRKRAEGVILGRPMGSKPSKTKLTGHEKKIQELIEKKVSYSAIGRILGVHRLTVSSFVKERMN